MFVVFVVGSTALMMVIAVRNSVTITTAHCQVTIHVILVVVVSLLSVIFVVWKKILESTMKLGKDLYLKTLQ